MKTIALNSLMLLVLAGSIHCSFAQFSYFTYNGTIAIDRYSGPGGEVEIPSSIDGLPVTLISGGAFAYNTNVTSISIPATVTDIRLNAFLGCSSLQAIEVDPLNPAYRSLDGVLFNPSQTELLFYPSGRIGAYTIPEGVWAIGNSAFFQSANLTSVDLGSGIIIIGRFAFQSCSSLTEVSIPDSVTQMREGAFAECKKLAAVTISQAVTNIESWTFARCASLTDIVIPYGVTKIGIEAFSDCTSLTSIILPNSVTTIGSSGFYGCTSLTQLTIPDGVTQITNRVIGGCTSLTNVTLGNNVTHIWPWALAGCSSLSSIIIPDHVTFIGDRAFSDCSNLTQIELGNSLVTLGSSVFYHCVSLARLAIPSNVSQMGSYTFSGCLNLTEIEVDPNNPFFSSLDGILMDKFQTTILACPEGKTGDYLIPDSVTSIGNAAFNHCASLTGIVVPNTVTDIGLSAFENCANLSAISLGNSVTNIATLAFFGCGSLASVMIPPSVLSLGYGVFLSCTNLISIEVDPLNPVFSSLDGVLFNHSQSELLLCPEGKFGAYTMPATVGTVTSSAFGGCTRLTSIYVSAGVTNFAPLSIQPTRNTFSECSSLNWFEVDPLNPAFSSLDGVLVDKNQSTLISYPAGRSGDYRIPASVSIIDVAAFDGANGLETITIPETVTIIRESAFINCSSLVAVYYEGNQPDRDYPFCWGQYDCPYLFDEYLTAINAINYYLPGTMGWGGRTYGGRRTAVWLPAVSNVARSGGQFGFSIHWASNRAIVVEASSDLSSSDWAPIATNMLPNGTLDFIDPDAADHPARFYRLSWP